MFRQMFLKIQITKYLATLSAAFLITLKIQFFQQDPYLIQQSHRSPINLSLTIATLTPKLLFQPFKTRFQTKDLITILTNNIWCFNYFIAHLALYLLDKECLISIFLYYCTFFYCFIALWMTKERVFEFVWV